MAIYTHREVPGAPTSFWFLVVGNSGATADSTSTRIVLANTDATITNFFGSGFVYGGPDVVGGTITSLTRSNAANTIVYETIMNVSLSGALVFDQSPAQNNALIFRGNDILNGWSKNDYLAGFNGGDIINCNGGNDLADGGAGNDFLRGGAASDILHGGLGKDTLTGGTQRDLFNFISVLESRPGAANYDVITDFQRGNNNTGDDIDLRGIDAKAGTIGNDAFKWIGLQAFHHVKGELHYKDIAGPGVLVEGDTNGDAAPDFQILVKNVSALAAGDFLA